MLHGYSVYLCIELYSYIISYVIDATKQNSLSKTKKNKKNLRLIDVLNHTPVTSAASETHSPNRETNI